MEASAFASAAAAEEATRETLRRQREAAEARAAARAAAAATRAAEAESIVARAPEPPRASRARFADTFAATRARDASPPRRPCRRSRAAPPPAAAFASRDANETRGSRWRRRRSWARRMTSPPRFAPRGRWD